jgi:basic membrane protein A
MVSLSQKIGLGIAALALAGGAAYAFNHNQSAETTSDTLRVAMVTDLGGVDDKSFNQSAWEGLQAFGQENGGQEGQDYNYFQSKSASDFKTNFQLAQKQGFDLIAGIGYALHNATIEAAKANPDTKYVLVDDIDQSKQKNLVSLMFRSEQSAYLVGVAAAIKAQELGDKQVGFVGGIHGNIIDAFDAGFEAGVQSVDPEITVKKVYAESFTDSAKGRLIANTMIADDIHVIFHASGAVGNGVFSAAKDVNTGLTADSKDKVWVAGVDMDQSDMGAYTTKDGKKDNFTMTSSLTKIGEGLKMVAEDLQKGEFKGGTIVAYGLKEDGVGVVRDNLNEEQKAAVDKAQKAIEAGDIQAPAHPEGSEFNQEF